MKFDEINKKAYHFTLERKDPNNENVPEAVIPEDKCLYFQPKEMLELRQFYKTEGYDAPFESLRDYAQTPMKKTGGRCLIICIVVHLLM